MAKEGEIPREKIIDTSELADYHLRKREEFEYLVRRYRWNASVWIKYAEWEESQKDLVRARSVWERAIEFNFGNHHIFWIKYAEMELKNKFIYYARSVLDRAVSLFPLIIQLWYKYIQMEEEILHNVDGAREVFELWMRRKPDQQGWLSYIEFELRNNEIERARGIFERFVECHPKVGVWIRFAKFEMKNREVSRARKCYEMAVKKLTGDEEAEQLLVGFEAFEKLCKEECYESTGSAAHVS